jgi:DNA-binding beta-propeller fold protein YncE
VLSWFQWLCNFVALFFVFHTFAVFGQQDSSEMLRPTPPVALPGPVGKFDYMASDVAMGRVLAAHRGAKTLEVVDSKSGQNLPAIEVGHMQGIAIDSKDNKYFLGNEAEHSIAVVDSRTLKVMDFIKVDGPVDAMTYDGKHNLVFAAEDDGDHLWVIDAKSDKLVGRVSIPGVPEFLVSDPKTNRIYLNIKNKDQVVQIDPSTKKVEATWSTLPAKSPHGLAMDSVRGRIYSAGGNGKLIALDVKTGKVISSVDIAPHVDQIAFDEKTQRIYSAGKGYISITSVLDSGLQAAKPVASPPGAHTLAVDPLSHDVWISYADDKYSFLQRYTTLSK